MRVVPEEARPGSRRRRGACRRAEPRPSVTRRSSGMNCPARRRYTCRNRSSLFSKNEYTDPTANPASSATSFERRLVEALAAEHLLGRVEQLRAAEVLVLQPALRSSIRLATVVMTTGSPAAATRVRGPGRAVVAAEVELAAAQLADGEEVALVAAVVVRRERDVGARAAVGARHPLDLLQPVLHLVGRGDQRVGDAVDARRGRCRRPARRRRCATRGRTAPRSARASPRSSGSGRPRRAGRRRASPRGPRPTRCEFE